MDVVVQKSVQDAVKKSMQTMAPKTDTMFKETLDRTLPQMRYVCGLSTHCLNFKSTMITESIRQPVQQTFVHYFQDMLIPSFEQSCKVMFNQLNTTFETGVQGIYIFYSAMIERLSQR